MPNCLFRVGGAAMLLSNKRRDAWRAKYELLHTVRTHLGANDLAYKCIYQASGFPIPASVWNLQDSTIVTTTQCLIKVETRDQSFISCCYALECLHLVP